MKIAPHTLLADLMAVVLVLPASISAQRPPKAEAKELSTQFHETDVYGNACRICMDDGHQFYSSNRFSKSYPNNVVFTRSGTHYMRIQRNQKVAQCMSTRTTTPPGRTTGLRLGRQVRVSSSPA